MNAQLIVAQLISALSHLLFIFSTGTQTFRIIGVSPIGSSLLLEVPLSGPTPKRVLTARLTPCMEKKNLTQARSGRELVLRLLGTLISEQEYRLLQEGLVLAGFSSPNNEKEVQST